MSIHDAAVRPSPGRQLDAEALTHHGVRGTGGHAHDHAPVAAPPSVPRPRMPMAVWALVIGAFAMGADEFIVAGVVQEIAAALKVTIGEVGHLESAYAVGVAVGAPLFAALGTRFPRRSMLFAATGVFLAGNLFSALGPTYGLILSGRVVSADGAWRVPRDRRRVRSRAG